MVSEIYPIDKAFKAKSLFWAAGFEQYCFLNFENCQINYATHAPFPSILAAGSNSMMEQTTGSALQQLKQFHNAHHGWKFGYLGYDLKNEIERLSSVNEDKVSFPDLFFFVPKHVLRFEEHTVNIVSSNPLKVFNEIQSTVITAPPANQKIVIQHGVSKDEYIRNVNTIKNHILEGDVYELNYCIDFFAENTQLNPEHTFMALAKNNPMPFAGLLKNKDQYILSASPERFLKKEGNRLISQPMKGTARRSADKEEDLQLRTNLKQSEKERAENMMIVDLVRNDLARSSKPGTTTVEEIFGIYSLSNVHQMISTVTSELREEVNFIDAIKNAFPMGSMTGAPKIRAMEIIDQIESTKRGAYSGALGYFDPTNNFDFNVIIRSIIYNASKKYLSFHAGSAITYDSIPEKEYEECLLKASAIKKVLEKV